MKGLPLGYSKDLQEDKEPIFDSYRTIKLTLEVINEIFKSIKIDKKSMMKSSCEGYTTATDLADWMVKNLNITFREAHNKTGKIVLIAERNKKIHELSLDLLQSIEPRIKKQVFVILTSEKSIKEKNSYGGTSKKQILNAIKKEQNKKLKMKKRLFKILFLILLSISVFGCGKKSDLVKYPDSEYSKELLIKYLNYKQF